jgi:MFS family permease
MLCFLFENSHLWVVLITMSAVGVGIGLTFSAMPRIIMRAVPAGETGSALSTSQVIRMVGFSFGSALCGTVLEANTKRGSAFPLQIGYQRVAIVGAALCVLTMVVSWLLPRRMPVRRDINPVQEELVIEESLANGLSADDVSTTMMTR